jgi:hypothetical protein
MGFAGRWNGKGRTWNDKTWEWAVLGVGNGKGKIRNENDRTENGGRTRNDRLPCSLNK